MFGTRPPATTKTLRILSALLTYPDARLRGHLGEMPALLAAERALSAERLSQLETLIGTLRDGDPLQVEAGYVELFDRGRATSLHLFEHVHGDSRDRGPAMIDLGQTYEKAGLVLADGELPDYLPAVLEFASTQPPREARAFVAEMAHILASIHAALTRRGSGYAAVLRALLELAGEPVKDVEARLEEPLDQSWAEPAAFDGCSIEGQRRPGQPQPVRIVRKHVPVQGDLR